MFHFTLFEHEVLEKYDLGKVILGIVVINYNDQLYITLYINYNDQL